MPLKQTDVAFLQGYDTLAFIRKLKDAGTTQGQLIHIKHHCLLTHNVMLILTKQNPV